MPNALDYRYECLIMSLAHMRARRRRLCVADKVFIVEFLEELPSRGRKDGNEV